MLRGNRNDSAYHSKVGTDATMRHPLKVAVIGAGVSGLSAARELHQEGQIVVVFEKNDRIGGTWVYDPRIESDPLSIDANREIVHSSVYLSLRTNLPRQLMSFLDYPFAKRENGDPRTFPGHDEVLWFLENFAGEFGLHKLIRFSTEVVRVERVEGRKDEWVVESKPRDSEMVTRETFEAVVVCSGHYTEPKLAEIPGIEKWPGFQMHSHNYRVPQPFQGQAVVLIGFGPTCFEISREIATLAKEVHVAIRRTDPILGNMKLENYDNIYYHPTVKYASEDGLVAFDDGSLAYADTIIHCTGYKYNFPFLESNGIISIEDNRVGPLYKHVFPPALAPSLSFIGLTFKDYIFQVLELQSKWVARVLSGKILLPTEEEMMNSVEEYYQQMEENGLAKRHTHGLRPYQADYKHWLVEQIGLPPLEDWRESMFMESFMGFVLMKHNYRDQWDDAYWDSFIQSSQAS